MSIGTREVMLIRRVEEELDRLGMRMAVSYNNRDNSISVYPKDENHLPCFNHQMSLFEGTIEELAMFLHGVDWARRYDLALGLKTDQRRERSEQKVRNRKLLDMIGESNE